MMVRGVIVGVMFMDDEKGHDSKVVISETGAAGGPAHALTAGARARIGGFFDRYKQYEPHGHSNVAGWGSIEIGLEYVLTTHAFFAACRAQAGRPCRRP
jgi:inorganic pyrophosphatase